MKRFLLIALAVTLGLAGAGNVDAKKRVRKHRAVNHNNQVWTHLGGQYNFSDANLFIVIGFSVEEDGVIETADINGNAYQGHYDKRTHLITFTDDNGKVVLRGKIYDGGNLFKGTVFGRKREARNPCGL